VENLQFPAT